MAEAKADRIIAEELKRRGWRAAELWVRRRSAAGKLEIAARVRRETRLTITAIAARVRLGSAKAANRNLHRHMRDAATGGGGRRKARR